MIASSAAKLQIDGPAQRCMDQAGSFSVSIDDTLFRRIGLRRPFAERDPSWGRFCCPVPARDLGTQLKRSYCIHRYNSSETRSWWSVMGFPIPEVDELQPAGLPKRTPDEWGQDIALQEICEVAAQIMRTPASLVSLLHEKDQRFIAATGLDTNSIPRDFAFCAYTMTGPKPMLVTDAVADDRFASNPLVRAAPYIRAYAGVPLEAAAGIRVGTLCAMDFEPREFSQQQIELLAKLGTVASSVLMLHKTCLELESEFGVRRPRDQDLRPVAHSDFLTDLANLKQFHQLAPPLLDKAFATRGCALIIIDIDNLESVKNQWERPEGGDTLRRVVRQLQLSIGKDDLVARLGGDQFAVLLADTAREEAVCLAERILIDLQTIADITGKPGIGRATIGIALAPRHATLIDDLYNFADAALHSAKSAGGNRCHLYIPQSDRRSPAVGDRNAEYRRALEAEEFVPYYQPKFELQKRTLAGFEALARWNTNSRGVLAPSEFVDLLENEELASLLTRSMLVQMARQLRAWQDLGVSCGSLAINASASDFLNPEFARDFLRIVSDYSLQPRDFVLEVTERIILEEHDTRLHNSLNHLQTSGVTISLDDFGTGYAGLQHLRNWPVNQIKIDRMFIRDILKDSRDSAIVESIIQMSDAIGLSVTAEGIETSEQLELLRNLQCEMGQGDFFARPMPAADVPEYVRKFRHCV